MLIVNDRMHGLKLDDPRWTSHEERWGGRYFMVYLEGGSSLFIMAHGHHVDNGDLCFTRPDGEIATRFARCNWSAVVSTDHEGKALQCFGVYDDETTITQHNSH